jgi:hypothetical protein
MLPFVQVTDVDHDGAVFEEVTVDQVGSPERLCPSVKAA